MVQTPDKSCEFYYERYKKVLSLDLSLSETGAAYFEDKILIKSASFKTKKGNIFKRAEQLARWIPEYFPEILSGDGRFGIVYEGLAFLSFKLGDLALFQGAVLTRLSYNYPLLDIEADFVSIAPSALKKRFAGHGFSKKEDIQKVLKEKHGLIIENNNIADAIALGIIFQRPLVEDCMRRDMPNVRKRKRSPRKRNGAATSNHPPGASRAKKSND